MVSAVSSRPNHYQTLGLAPSASKDEIGRAFAREIGMFQPRALGDVALVSVAFETLRDPVKRRAYDASLGLMAEPQPRPAPPTAWRDWTQFIGAAPVRPTERSIRHDLPPAATPMKPPAEPKTASFIAASVRGGAEPARQNGIFSGPASQPEPPRRPEPEAELQISGDRLFRHAEQLRLGEVEDRPVEWRRTAFVIGGPIMAVAILGAFAGWQAGHGDGTQQAEAAVTAALPPPKPFRAAVSNPPAPSPSMAQAQPLRLPRVAVAARTRRAPAAPQLAAPGVQLSEATQSDSSQPEANATDPLAAEPAAVETAAALPLSNAVIARTIDRIGYACGKVASTSAVEGQGAYKVTCTSGQSYTATPVRGRYHFRRLGGH